MVLESLFNPFTLKKHPWELFLAGFIYSMVGLLISYFVFKEIAGILTIFLIVLATVPMLFSTIKQEEELSLENVPEIKLLKEHTKVLVYLIFLFLGITFALVLSYVFLPHEISSSIFKLQEQAIVNINSDIQGNVIHEINKFDIFLKIVINNIKVLFFCIIFSFLYGTGAIFILTWNASVIAAAIGSLFKTEIAKTASLVGFPYFSSYFGAITFSFFRYMTHGILEIAAYFVAGLAGGIISIALIKHNLQEEKVLIDALDLILISLGILVLAGIVEVYITPIFFT